ncbi:hypothetical protein B0H14DRAFT_2725363 [Mycena olivaceomarginata]|nr:hypothetical protein B0H14DRAFT_2725363 [Mycena olivaceomarginata]
MMLKDYAIGYAIISIVTIFFIPAPVLIKYYYPDANLPPFAVACLRAKDITGCAFTAATFCTAIVMFSMLLNDARQWLTRARRASPARTLGHVALEDGTAPHVPPASQSNPMSSLVSVISTTFFFTQQMFAEDVVSLKRPLRENLGSALLYILRGLRLLFPAGLIFLFVVWRKNRRAAVEDSSAPSAASTPRIEILLEKEESVDAALVKEERGAIRREGKA